MRVAHDRQQRVQEQRDQRRHGADAPEQRRSGTRAARATGWSGSRRPSRGSAARHGAHLRRQRRRAARRSATAAASDTSDQHEVLARQAPEVGSEQRAEQGARRGHALPRGSPARARASSRTAPPPAANDLPSISAAAFRRIIRRASMRPSSPASACQAAGKRCGSVQPVEQHRVVAREEAAVVLEHAQLVALDLRVGRVDVHHVDLPRRERLVGEAVVEARRRRERQAVGRLQPRPAVGAADELLRQAEAQARMPREVGERPDAERPRAAPRASPARRCC